jgi:hypothetical protein
MTDRYEIVRSSDDPPLMLIFFEGSWEGLPFEIRLLRRWYESEFSDRPSTHYRCCVSRDSRLR